MAIETQTNFIIQATVPADDRNVVENISARDNIEYKFAGLKTFVLSEGITYVYGTDSVWRVDGGVSSVGGGNGIYGGSGSIPGDVSVFLGTVSNNINNRSSYLYFETDGQTDGDKNYLYNYSYRKVTGQDWDTMAYRTEQKLLPFGSTIKQGPFIEYNGRNPQLVNKKSVLNLGSGNQSDLTTRVVRVSITPTDTEFYSSQDPIGVNESPVSIHQIDGDTYFGFNTTGDINTNGSSFCNNEDAPTYRMKFLSGLGLSNWNFETRVKETTLYDTIIKIDANVVPSSVSSNLKFLVDTSSRDWDTTSTRVTSLLTPQQIVRDIEHRYTKIQMLNVGTPQPLTSDQILYLNTEGNSFVVSLNKNDVIKNIKAYKTSTSQPEFPNGTIINIKFINTDPTLPGHLRIYDGNNDSRIKSDITDATFNLNNDSRLTINHNSGTLVSDNGEIITFRKFNKEVSGQTQQWWEIVNVNRERRIVERKWPTPSVSEWNFNTTIKWLTATATSGSYQIYDGTNVVTPITSLDNPPNKWPLPSGGSTVAFTRETTNPDGFRFRISVDGNRIVFVQGNFRIDIKDGNIRNTLGGNNIKKFYFRSVDNRTNIWNIGKISNTSLLPQWETTWTPVRCYGTGVYSGSNLRWEIIDPVFSINRLGDMFLSFDAEASYDSNLEVSIQGMLLEVYVPPFSYTAATGSFTV